MFGGRDGRDVDFSGAAGNNRQDRKALLAQARQQRAQRKETNTKDKAARCLQRFMRRTVATRKIQREFRQAWAKEASTMAKGSFKRTDANAIIWRLCFFYRARDLTREYTRQDRQKVSQGSATSTQKVETNDFKFLVLLCVVLLRQLGQTKTSNRDSVYFGAALRGTSAADVQAWIEPLRKLICLCVSELTAVCSSKLGPQAHRLFYHEKNAKEYGVVKQFLITALDPSLWNLKVTTEEERQWMELVFGNLYTQLCVKDGLLQRLEVLLEGLSAHATLAGSDTRPQYSSFISVIVSVFARGLSIRPVGHHSDQSEHKGQSVAPVSSAAPPSFFDLRLLYNVITAPLVCQHFGPSAFGVFKQDNLAAFARLVEVLWYGLNDSRQLEEHLSLVPNYHNVSSLVWFIGNILKLTHETRAMCLLDMNHVRQLMQVLTGLLRRCSPRDLALKGRFRSEWDEDEDDDSEELKSGDGSAFATTSAQAKEHLKLLSDQLALVFHPVTFNAVVWRMIFTDGIAEWRQTKELASYGAAKGFSVSPGRYMFKPAMHTELEDRMQDVFATFHYSNPKYLETSCEFFDTALERCVTFRLVNQLSFSTPILNLLWKWLRNHIAGTSWKLWEDALKVQPVRQVFSLFVRCYNQVLVVLEDAEFSNSQMPFRTNADLLMFATVLKVFVFRRMYVRELTGVDLVLRASCKTLLHELYRRDVRVPFAPKDFWLISKDEDAGWHALWQGSDLPSINTVERLAIVKQLWFVIPFMKRVMLMRKWIADDERESGGGDMNMAYELVIRRDQLIADGFAAVERLGSRFKRKIKVKFVDKHGREEKGIDLGGPFKEFLETLVKEVFRPEYALFKVTPAGDFYPNPAMHLIPDFLQTMEFVGRIVGKALYEGILVDVPFAAFFLCKILHQPTFLSLLASVDKELHKNLLFLKDYDGNVEDLALSFTVADNSFGENKEIPLVPNGANVDVTNENRIRYIYKVADYHLRRKIQDQSRAFLAGLSQLIKPEWIEMFNVNELRLVLSGTPGDIDVEDWKKYTNYDRCSPNDKPVKWFWSMMENATGAERQAVLRFATSCSRPPLMGFKYLQPPFSIRLVDAGEAPGSSFVRFFTREKSKAFLPSAATCFNLLKLPAYDSKDTLKEKLSLAMKNDTGFELT